MKKTYIAPSIEIETVEMENMLLAASPTSEIKIWNDEEADDSEAMGKQHGRTFNLWDTDEE